jgi:exopolyphosphatase/guanosine-5'-triphosphate,3'-diphosphate pyrophosphatase
MTSARTPARRPPARPAPEPPAKPATASRLAAIDVGSNSIHMVIVETDGAGGYRVLARERDMVRLGKSALARGRLSRRAIRDGLESLLRMTTLARLKGVARVEAVATSAVREAANGDELLEQAHALTGLAIRVLDGEQEGQLIFRAVRHAVELGRGWSVLVDVGGGSTEWCNVRGGRLASVRSLELGSLRGAERLAADPPTTREIERLRREIRERLEKVRAPSRTERLIATSGTALCCGELVDHLAGREGPQAVGGLRELRLRDLSALVATLRSLKRREIASLPAVGRPRAGSILAGAVLLEELARHAGVDRLHLCDRALREGLVLEMLGDAPVAPAPEGGARRRQVIELAQRAPAVWEHAQQVARLATRLFDLTAPVHNLGAREREWLEYAALLHDVGYSIHFERHHKHSLYLISTAGLDAFDPREIEIVAHVARYHRGGLPKKRHAAFAALRPWQQETVRRLAALLRLANALDRTHAARVVDLHASLVRGKRAAIEVLSPFDVGLELAAARRAADLFEKQFRRRVVLRQGLAAHRRGGRRAAERNSFSLRELQPRDGGFPAAAVEIVAAGGGAEPPIR